MSSVTRRFALFGFACVALGCQSPLVVDMPDETGVRDDSTPDAFDAALEDTKTDSAKDTSVDDGSSETSADGDDASDADASDADPPWDGTIECDAGDAATDAAPGTRFCELYVDLFAPTGVAKCQSTTCHGGSIGVVGFAMGWTGKSCYDAMTTHKVGWLPPYRVVEPVPGGDSRPKSLLPIITDPAADAGILMPWLKTDNRLLNDGERARINAWLSRGAPFD